MNESFFDVKLLNEAIGLAEQHAKRLYEMPEKAFEEYRTTAYIKEVCGNYPVEIIDIGMETGVACYLDVGCDETVGLRADIDALITEQGPKHLCGHNAHAVMLV